MKRFTYIFMLALLCSFGFSQSTQKQAFQEEKVDTFRTNHKGPKWGFWWGKDKDSVFAQMFYDSVLFYVRKEVMLLIDSNHVTVPALLIGNGSVYLSGTGPVAGVSSFNTRTGDVTLLASDGSAFFFQRSDSGAILLSKPRAIELYQPKATYLIPNDSTLNRTYSDARYSLKVGSSSIVTVGALISGSIASGFTAIDTARTNAVSIVYAGSNVTVTPRGKGYTIASSGGGGTGTNSWWEVDMQGNLMPRTSNGSDNWWELDAQGNLMPKAGP